VYVNRVGAIYVADYTRIQKWAGATSGTTVAGGNGSGTNPNQFQSTRSVFVDEENGDVYVIQSFDDISNQWLDAVITNDGEITGYTFLNQI